jgi:ketosteroid isomerase-like protein
MRPGASTPEELELLFEDALVLGDRDAVAQLFDHEAVLVAADGATEARGSQRIARLATTMCDHGYSYLADPRLVLQTLDITLVVAERYINVMRRHDRRWRYAISLLHTDDTTERTTR